MKQERMFCRECKREWMVPSANYTNSSPCSITGNPINGGNCPVCGSPELELVQYEARFAGADIPRNEGNMPVPMGWIPEKPLEIIPGLVGTGNHSIRMEPNFLLMQAATQRDETRQDEIEEPPDIDRIEYGE